MLRRGQHRQRNGRGDAHRVRQTYDLDGRPEYVSVLARGLLASSYIVLRGDLITPRTQPGPQPGVQWPPAASGGRPAAGDAPGGGQPGAESGKRHHALVGRRQVGIKLRTQAPQSGERPVWRMASSKARRPMTAVLLKQSVEIYRAPGQGPPPPAFRAFTNATMPRVERLSRRSRMASQAENGNCILTTRQHQRKRHAEAALTACAGQIS